MSRAKGEDAAGAVPKALRVLEAVAARRRPLSIAEIAAALDLPQPTAHRIVGTLEKLGFVGREPGRRRIIEGSRFVNLGLDVLRASAGSGTRHALLATLAKKTGESCNLGVMAGNHVVYVDRVESQWPLGLRFEPGSRVPLHCTAIGKLLLSQLPDDIVDAHLANGPLARYTATTITDPRRLREELRRTRRQGYSVDNEEFMSGVVCIAVPVQGPRDGQVCAGLAISAAQARHNLAGVKRFLPDLRTAAGRLSRALAGEGGVAGEGAARKVRTKRAGKA